MPGAPVGGSPAAAPPKVGVPEIGAPEIGVPEVGVPEVGAGASPGARAGGRVTVPVGATPGGVLGGVASIGSDSPIQPSPSQYRWVVGSAGSLYQPGAMSFTR
jgi:hypothetical protein